MYQRSIVAYARHISILLVFFCSVILLCSACGGGSTAPTGTSALATKQVLTFPNVGTAEIGYLDPALGPDTNSAIAVNMIYSGLVKTDKDLNVLPDQATWSISDSGKVYTFTLASNLQFSDGTPVTAQDYVYTWTRALLPEVNSPIAIFFEKPIVGANDVNTGKAKELAGVKALDAHTLQVTLTRPTPYFLADLTTSLFFPLNHRIIDKYGQKNWIQYAADNGIGTGPFMVKRWQHNVKMTLVPNPHYYGQKTKLTTVEMSFVKDQSTAFQSYQAGQYDFTWNLTVTDQAVARNTPGFKILPILQTDSLFFDNTKPPFDNLAIRQAFAYATDKFTLAHVFFKDSVTPAPTIIPPGMPGYQSDYQGIPYDRGKAKALLQSVYPDVSKVPPIIFSFPSSQVTPDEAAVLQQMWQNALDIQVKLRPVELNAYNDEAMKHEIQFGFIEWTADFPDPYDWLTLNLFSTATNNNGAWRDATFDQLVTTADTTSSGTERIALYNRAEQIAISNVGWLPLDHETETAIIPSWVHGVTLNSTGLFFGDWSEVYITQH
ncbi:MAG: peptide ABC transporter substrate-binding protein [Ktedonobacteraceae bacterium]|nr:peptide ABC transporter substrate-binding protein [Ktedonobacteraceae bacterium]